MARIRIKYGVTPNLSHKGGWLPVVHVFGPGDAREDGWWDAGEYATTYASRGYDEETALEMAREQAERESERWAGDFAPAIIEHAKEVDTQKRTRMRGLRGPAEAALLDRASLAFDEGDLEEGEEYLAAVRETHMSRARSGRYPTPEEIAEYDRLSRRRAELLAPIAEAERGKDRPRYIGSLRGLRGHCEDAIREATENLRRAKTPAQRRAAQKYMKQVKSRCGLGRLRGPRLGGKR